MGSLFAILMAVACSSPPTGPQSTQDDITDNAPTPTEPDSPAQVTDPGQVSDLIVTDSSGTAVTLSFTQVDDGAGNPADYAVRTHVGPMNWGAAEEVSQGTCAAPLQGDAIGSTMSCTIEGLVPDVTYTFQVAAFRGAFQAGAVYGELSNVVPEMENAPEESPPSDGSHPYEPAGLSPIASVDFSNGISAQVGECWERESTANRTEYLTGQTTPTGDGSVFRGRFPKGAEDGGSYWRFDCWGPERDGSGAYDYDEVYVSFWLKIEGNDFENQTVGTKVFYVAYGSTTRGNHSTMFFNGTYQDQAIMSSMTPSYYIYEMEDDGSDAGGGSIKRNPNLTNEKIRPGQWQHIEAHFKINDIGPTRDNGEFKMWVDGVATHHLTGLRWRSTENPKSFYQLQFTPVYGGNNGDVRTRDDYWQIDNVYISARD